MRQTKYFILITNDGCDFLCFFFCGQGLIILALGEHLWIGKVMEMLLWKAVSLFILLYGMGSSGKNLLRT
jgi:hypothetical protein